MRHDGGGDGSGVVGVEGARGGAALAVEGGVIGVGGFGGGAEGAKMPIPRDIS